MVIKKLLEYKGVGFPLATSILKFINPEVFPIIDIRDYGVVLWQKKYIANMI